jgi:membrane-associated phospholipid phosphatase
MDIINPDIWLFYLINHGSVNALFDILMPVLSNKGYLLALPLGAYIMALACKEPPEKRRAAIHLAIWTIVIAVISFLLADWFTNEIKYVIKRIRPCNALEGVRLLGGCTQTYSHPSGHSTNSFAYAIALFIMTRGTVKLSWRIYPLALAGLVAYSRVYLGVHYPADVISGAIVGGLSAFMVISLFRFAKKKYMVRPYSTIFVGSLIAVSILRFYHILRGPLALNPEEALSLQFAGAMDSSGIVVGPLPVWMIAISTAVFGENVFGIRIFALLLSSMSCYLMFRLAKELYHDEAVALWAALLLMVIPMFSLPGLIMTHESPLLFFWILSLYLFYGTVKPGSEDTLQAKVLTVRWIQLGIAVGIGLMAGWTMLLFYAGMLIYLLMSDRKYLLKTVNPYIFIAISTCPLLILTAVSGLPAVSESAQMTEGRGLLMNNLTQLFLHQAVIMTPIMLVLIFYALHDLFYKKRCSQSIYLFAFSIPVMIISFVSGMLLNHIPDLAIIGYVTGILAVAYLFFRKDEDKGLTSHIRNARRAAIWTAMATAIMVAALSLFPSLNILSPKIDPVMEFRGWKELGTEVSALYNEHRAAARTVLVSDACGISSELAFYVSGYPETYCMPSKGQTYKMKPKGTGSGLSAVKDLSSLKAERAIIVNEGDRKNLSHSGFACGTVGKKSIKIYHKKRELKAYTAFICYNFSAL